MSLASRRVDIKWGKDKQRGEGNPNFAGGQYVDDKGYIRVLRPEHPFQNKGYVYMHRLVMEEYLGRYLQPWETVHHINEVKIDNRVDNFYLCKVPEHSAIHRGGKRKTMEQKTALRLAARERRKNAQRDGGGRFVKETPS